MRVYEVHEPRIRAYNLVYEAFVRVNQNYQALWPGGHQMGERPGGHQMGERQQRQKRLGF